MLFHIRLNILSLTLLVSHGWAHPVILLYSTADTAADMEKESLNNFYHFLWLESSSLNEIISL